MTKSWTAFLEVVWYQAVSYCLAANLESENPRCHYRPCSVLPTSAFSTSVVRKVPTSWRCVQSAFWTDSPIQRTLWFCARTHWNISLNISRKNNQTWLLLTPYRPLPLRMLSQVPAPWLRYVSVLLHYCDLPRQVAYLSSWLDISQRKVHWQVQRCWNISLTPSFSLRATSIICIVSWEVSRIVLEAHQN